MDIAISMLNGASHCLMVNPQDTVSSLKGLIQRKLGVSVQEQKLLFVNAQRTPLNDDSKPLSWYGLQSGSQVSLLITQPPPVQVFLRNEKGKLTTYDITPEETVDHFKARVEKREGVPVSRQRLLHQSREMTTGRLTDYDVANRSTIHLMSMLVTQPPPVQVFLRNEKGKSTTYDITPEETVDHFKARVEKREEVPVSLQRLLHQSTEITTGRLTDYDVTNHSTIHLMSMLVTQRPPVQVFLRNEKGKSTTYDITPEETVDHFKARVEKREGVPVSRQRLLHQSREMTTGRLTDYNITNHSTIHLMSVLVTQPPPVQVFLRNEKGKSTTYDITPDETMDHFKARVEKREGVSVSRQRLLHQSREMTTGRLTDYNVTNHSTIHLMSMLVTQRPPVQVFLRNEKGKSTTYEITPEETVDHFKARVEKREGVPVSRQRLLHQSREMTTGRLTDYNITNHSTIHLMSMLVTQPPPVQVFLRNEKGKSTTYDITPDETVDHFKARVEKREEVRVSQQRLFHQSREMTTGRLTDYDVTNHSTIHLMSMLVTQPPPVQVFLRNETGKSTTYDITLDETVDHFKARVEKREGVPVSQQRLLHQSREMTTGRLTDYDVTNHSTIHLMSMLVTQPPPVQVFLRNEKDKSTTYDITPEETVDHFKARVEQREEVPVSRQRLLHQSREMTTGRLTDYDVENHSTILLMSMLVTQPPPVQVFLRNEKGKLTTYDITPEETVDHFKARVEKREGVPVSRQRLLHQSREMTTGRLTDYDVTNHSTIHLMSMLVTQPPPVQVFLRNEKGKSTTYDITPDETVDHFKARVEKREGVPVSRQRLLHQSTEMTTGRLTDYDLTNHSTIHLMSMLVTQRPPVQVFLRNEKGKLTTYDITPEETVDHFKARVEKREEVRVSRQRLLHQSTEMTTGRLTDYSVTNHSTIHLMSMLVTQPPPVQVFLRNEKGKSTTYDITPEETVDHFKVRVEKREGFPVSRQRLLHQSREMTTGRLTDYNVKNHSTIHLMLRLRLIMDITITMLGGASHYLTVNPQDTVSSLKQLIQNKLGVTVQEQKLVFVNGEKKTLNDNSKPLSWYGLQSGSQVSLLITKPPPFQVFLRNERGEPIPYDITPGETVDHFKARVEQREGVPVSQQRLLHQGREMTTGRLTDYNVTNDSTIHLRLYIVLK